MQQDNHNSMKCIRDERTVKTTERKDSYIIINYVGNVATK